MSEVFRVDQNHCVPGRSVSDNTTWLRYVLDNSSSLDKATGLISIDQEEAFDWMHQYFVSEESVFVRNWENILEKTEGRLKNGCGFFFSKHV